MRRTVIWTMILAVTFAVGLIVGGFFQHLKTGYVYELRSQKTYLSPNGSLKLEYATESVGWPFLDPGTSTIVLEEPSSLEIVLYKSRRGFQESVPYPNEIIVTDNQIRWDDGIHAYTLQLEASQSSAGSSANLGRQN